MTDATHFGRFRLVERRALGGMGEVWHAVVEGARGVATNVVLKRVRPEYAADPGFVAMLAAEARVCARLDHPGIVKVYEFGEVAGEHYLAMELVDGWDLYDILAAFERVGRVPPVAFICQVGAELADALAYAHAITDEQGRPFGLVHRDVSPGNVMITRQGAVKLVDFGVHTIRNRSADERTAVGVLRGTLSFMSPEQADGQPVDRRSDVFSLGSVLYEALTGHRLFRAASELETLRRVREAVVVPASTYRRDLDPRLDRILLAMLARSPLERWASCDDVARELRPFAQEAGIDAASVRELLGGLDLAGGDTIRTVRQETQPLMPSAPATRAVWLWAALLTALIAMPYAIPACNSSPRNLPPAGAAVTSDAAGQP
ncbi:MAG: putative serine/threonine protein kinase [Myxococcales bacterium]|nr:putative serine/threonine protein kinase [Myxococcales bacterium]